jgi:hypothetical protein
MYGLTVRWSLTDAPAGTSEQLRTYVRETSLPRFTGMPGLVQKTWQLVDQGFFAGVYVWQSAQARADFLEHFRSNPSPVTQLVGHGPDVVEEWDVVAIAIGAEGPLTP